MGEQAVLWALCGADLQLQPWSITWDNSRCGLKEAVALGEPLKKQPRAGGATHGDPCWNTVFLEDINIETILEELQSAGSPLGSVRV